MVRTCMRNAGAGDNLFSRDAGARRASLGAPGASRPLRSGVLVNILTGNSTSSPELLTGKEAVTCQW